MIFQSLCQLIRLMRSQWLTPSEIEEIQRRRLKTILRHAYENVTYYHQLFNSAGVNPEEINDRDGLSKIPITTKSLLQGQSIEEITAKGTKLDHCLRVKTSGSTGRPLDIIMGEKDRSFRGALFMRAFLAHGYRLRDREVNIVNLSIGHHKRWYQNLGIRRQNDISAFAQIDEQIQHMRRMKPDIIHGVPSSLLMLAKAIRQEGVKDIRPRMIIGGGEILPSETREFVNSTFGVEMIDLYNSWEFGNIAWECSRHAGYHINADSFVVEFIREGKAVLPGEKGEIVITSLNSYTMPFIRYNIADIGIPSDKQCPCGRGLPLLERVEGRTDDIVRLSDGRLVSPYMITIALRFIHGITRFKFVQEREDKFLVLLEREKTFGQEPIEEVRGKLKKILGDAVNVEVQILDEIPCDPSGKLRSVISKVKS